MTKTKYLFQVWFFSLIVLFLPGLYPSLFSQVEPCSKPRVGVIMEIFEEKELAKHLNEQYPSQPKGTWLYEIQEKALEELKMNSPGTQFIPATSGIPEGCDYVFRYRIGMAVGGKDIEVGGAMVGEYTVYLIRSTLWENSPCGFAISNVGKTINTENEDIFQTIEQNIAAHGNIGDKIREHEESHRVPPRGPEMNVLQEREYVSPLEEERKLKVQIDVTNCKGEPVYDPGSKHGQKVILPKNTERGELNCTKGFPDGEDCQAFSNHLLLWIRTPKGASATYTLVKGMNAEKDPIKILTCGIDKKVVKETKIQIHGLELKIKPEKKEVFPMDEPKITIQLSEIDEKGGKQPVAGKNIQVHVAGIIDGDVDPPGDVTTDQNGEAVLTYDAGEKDNKVVFRAKFQPKDYPESVKDEAAITVSHYAGYVVMTYIIDYDYTDGDGHYHEDATVRYNLGEELQSLPVGEHFLGIWYPVKSANIIKANAKDVDNKPSPPRIKTGKLFHLPDLSEWAKNYSIIMFLDTKSGKFIRSGPLALDVDFTWSDGSESCIDKVHEDVLITGGDGVHVLTGSCSGDPGWTFSWTFHMRLRH